MLNMLATEVVSGTVSGSGIIKETVGAFTEFLSGIGTGITGFFNSVFTNPDGGISVFAILSLSMLGLGLSVMMVKKLLSIIRR